MYPPPIWAWKSRKSLEIGECQAKSKRESHQKTRESRQICNSNMHDHACTCSNNPGESSMTVTGIYAKSVQLPSCADAVSVP